MIEQNPIKAQIDNGESISGLEEEIKTNQTRLNALDQASQKALRVHLYTPNYPIDKLEAEQRRIDENSMELKREQDRLKRQIDELRQAMVDEEGLRRFCEIATCNLDSLNDGQWRVLLETMKVRILINDAGVTVKMAVPFTKEETSVIADSTSRCLYSGNKIVKCEIYNKFLPNQLQPHLTAFKDTYLPHPLQLSNSICCEAGVRGKAD